MKITEHQLRRIIREELENASDPKIAPESQIYCDMDGVLVNFEDYVVTMIRNILDGGPLPGGAKKSRGYWGALGRLQDELGEGWRPENRASLDIKVVRNFMFRAISADPEAVYSEMGAHPDAISQLWPFLTSSGHIVNLLTAPINDDNFSPNPAGNGKRRWAQQLSPAPSAVIISPARQKASYAMTDGIPNILIDDRASTVDDWNARGGIGVLHVPRDSASTIAALQSMGL